MGAISRRREEAAPYRLSQRSDEEFFVREKEAEMRVDLVGFHARNGSRLTRVGLVYSWRRDMRKVVLMSAVLAVLLAAGCSSAGSTLRSGAYLLVGGEKVRIPASQKLIIGNMMLDFSSPDPGGLELNPYCCETDFSNCKPKDTNESCPPERPLTVWK